MSTEFKRLTEEQYAAVADPVFNPAIIETEEQKQSFEREWWSACETMNRFLSLFGKCDQCGGADYGVTEDWGRSRGLSFAIFSPKMLVPSLVPALQEFLRKLDHEYVIFFGPDTVVGNMAMKPYGFDVVVFRDKVLAMWDEKSFSMDKEAFQKMGLVEAAE